MLDVRRLAILRAIRDHGSLSAAARSLYLSTSAVSQHMNALEREAGLPLLLRAPGSGGRLTAAGEILAVHAEALLSRLAEAGAEMAALAAQRAGRLRVATFAGPADTLLPAALDRLRAGFPGVDVDVRVTGADDAVARLRADETDLALLTGVPGAGGGEDGVVSTPVYAERFVLLVPDRHRWRHRPAVRLDELAGERWILGAPSGPTPEERIVRRACREAGFVPAVAHRADAPDAVRELVAAGTGIALVPELTTGGRAARRGGAVAVVPVAGRAPVRDVLVATARGVRNRPPAVDGLLRALREAAAAHALDRTLTAAAG
ncbi:LysR family transcriptional regulator [Pseudonocardia sp. NPDC046786]|uniref:LysR family transcriptional regulator n=1 Tax=Pseudonocardia sp. NPDC046786 TaxID=3155471 RepID=UPI0033C378A3